MKSHHERKTERVSVTGFLCTANLFNQLHFRFCIVTTAVCNWAARPNVPNAFVLRWNGLFFIFFFFRKRHRRSTAPSKKRPLCKRNGNYDRWSRVPVYPYTRIRALFVADFTESNSRIRLNSRNDVSSTTLAALISRCRIWRNTAQWKGWTACTGHTVSAGSPIDHVFFFFIISERPV